MHERSCFVTLTYDDDHLPEYGALVKEHLQKFIRALRDHGLKFSYFACGEYGEKLERPHYHVLLFGCWPDDTYTWAMRKNYLYYRSATFEKFWTKGFVEFSDVSPGNCEYVAGYIRKKLHGKKDETYWDHYERVADDGALYYLPEEFALMSKKPAIGKRWLEQNWRDVYPRDAVIMNGREWPVPEYYDKWLKEHKSDLWESVKQQRKDRALSSDYWRESSPSRLAQKDVCINARVNNQKRQYEQ